MGRNQMVSAHPKKPQNGPATTFLHCSVSSREIGFLPTPFSANFDPYQAHFGLRCAPPESYPSEIAVSAFRSAFRRTQADVDLERLYFIEHLRVQILVRRIARQFPCINRPP